MEAIRQNGKIILYGNDGISIKMIFKTLREGIFKVRSMRTTSATSQSGAWDLRPASSSIGGNPECMLKAENPMKLAASSDFFRNNH